MVELRSELQQEGVTSVGAALTPFPYYCVPETMIDLLLLDAVEVTLQLRAVKIGVSEDVDARAKAKARKDLQCKIQYYEQELQHHRAQLSLFEDGDASGASGPDKP